MGREGADGGGRGNDGGSGVAYLPDTLIRAVGAPQTVVSGHGGAMGRDGGGEGGFAMIASGTLEWGRSPSFRGRRGRKTTKWVGVVTGAGLGLGAGT